MDIPRESRRSQVVNLTPLIDVVFLLIVFFMLSTSFVVSESMELSIPEDSARAVQASEVWVLRVDGQGRINDGDDTLSLKRFDAKLRKRLSADKEQKMLLLAGAETSVQQLVSVLDKIYLAGGRQVQIDKERD